MSEVAASGSHWGVPIRLSWHNTTRNIYQQNQYVLGSKFMIRTVSVWVVIIASAVLWCVIAICYRRRRQRELLAELERRQAVREQQEQELLERAQIQRPHRHRQGFIDRSTRQSSGVEYEEMLTISVALARTPTYTPQYNPPSYSEAIQEPQTPPTPPTNSQSEDVGHEEPPPPYSSIFDSSNGGSPV